MELPYTVIVEVLQPSNVSILLSSQPYFIFIFHTAPAAFFVTTICKERLFVGFHIFYAQPFFLLFLFFPFLIG